MAAEGPNISTTRLPQAAVKSSYSGDFPSQSPVLQIFIYHAVGSTTIMANEMVQPIAIGPPGPT